MLVKNQLQSVKERPEIETYINPFQITEISHHDYGTPTQSHTPASASLQNTSFITENVLLSGSPQDASTCDAP